MLNLLIGILIGAVTGSVLTLWVTRRSKGAGKSDAPDDFARLIGSTGNKKRTNKSNLAALEQDLRVKCMHNAEQMERLIEAENERKPASREENVNAAIERWERDNH